MLFGQCPHGGGDKLKGASLIGFKLYNVKFTLQIMPLDGASVTLIYLVFSVNDKENTDL